MEIIAHRGFWKDWSERNSVEAFKRALEHGFGIETDIRDLSGQLVVSHNMPVGGELSFEDFLKLYASYGIDSSLALNIKADGLQEHIKTLLAKYSVHNYFVFDMSVPDTLGYLDCDMNVFSRRSEYESEMPFYGDSTGVWYDYFNNPTCEEGLIRDYLNDKKYVCFVSPELHKREYVSAWAMMKSVMDERFMLCTDYPDKALDFFMPNRM